MIALADILAARARFAGRIRTTPLIESRWLSDNARADVRLKLESLQISNSFKVRGALNAVARLVEDTPHGGPEVVTASAGNHGCAVAWAARLARLNATVFTPKGAPQAKLNAIRRYGADLRAIADDYEHAERLALAWAAEHGAVFISPYNHEDVIAGAGTIGVEIVDAWPDVDTVLVPIGGGGLVSGTAVAMKAVRPGAEVIGVEAEASRAFSASREAGHLVTVDVKPTIADGLGGNVEPESRTWPYVRDLVSRIVTVSEDDLAKSIHGLLGEEHLVAEGAGAAGVAAIVGRRLALEGRKVAVIVTGANIDLSRLRSLI